MFRFLAAAAVLALAATAAAAPADDVAALSWLAGTWEAKDGEGLVRETWLSPKDGSMGGAGQTNRPGKRPVVEFMKITAEPAGATFTALVGAQPPTPFVLKFSKPGEAVFENLAHDFPQRVILRRCGADYCPRIEGMVEGRLESQEWRYRRVRMPE